MDVVIKWKLSSDGRTGGHRCKHESSPGGGHVDGHGEAMDAAMDADLNETAMKQPWVGTTIKWLSNLNEK